MLKLTCLWSQENSVCVVTRLEFRCNRGKRFCYFSMKYRPTVPSFQWVPGGKVAMA